MEKRILSYATAVIVILTLTTGMILVNAVPSSAADKVITLRYQGKWGGHEKQNWAAEQLKFSDRVKAATNGKVIVENMDEVVKDNEVLDGVRKGVIDMGAQALHSRGELALVNFITLPFVEFEKMPEIYAKLTPTLDVWWDKQFGVKQMGYNFFLPAAIFTKNKATTLDELRGMKIRIGGTILVDLFKRAGCNPVVMNNADVYPALQRGMIDGGHTALPAYVGNGWYEICKYMSKWPVGSMGLAVIMNKNSWNKLGPELQKQVMAAWRETEKAQFEGIHKDIGVIEKVAFKDGAQWANPSQAEKDKLLSYMGPVLEDWKKKTGPLSEDVLKAINEVEGTNYK